MLSLLSVKNIAVDQFHILYQRGNVLVCRMENTHIVIKQGRIAWSRIEAAHTMNETQPPPPTRNVEFIALSFRRFGRTKIIAIVCQHCRRGRRVTEFEVFAIVAEQCKTLRGRSFPQRCKKKTDGACSKCRSRAKSYTKELAPSKSEWILSQPPEGASRPGRNGRLASRKSVTNVTLVAVAHNNM